MIPKISLFLSESCLPPRKLTNAEVVLPIAVPGLLRQPLPQLSHARCHVLLAQDGCSIVPWFNDADFHPKVVELTPGKEEVDSVWGTAITKGHQAQSL